MKIIYTLQSVLFINNVIVYGSGTVIKFYVSAQCMLY